MISNSIVGWSIALLIIGGLILYRWLRIKIRENKKVEPLKAFASENHAQLSEMDSWDRSLIGIDRKGPGTLFFIRKMPEGELREKIDLGEVSGCWMSKNNRTVSYKKESVHVIEHIELILSFHDRRPQVALEFYNEQYDSIVLTGELQLAQKWVEVISKLTTAHMKQRAAERKKKPVVASISVPDVIPPVLSGQKKGKRPLAGGRAA